MPESSVSADFGDDFRHAHILEDSAGAFLIKAQEPRAQLQRIPGGAHSGRPLFGTEHDAVERTRRAVGHGQPYGIRFADQRRQFRRLVRVIFQHVTKRTGKGLVTGEGSRHIERFHPDFRFYRSTLGCPVLFINGSHGRSATFIYKCDSENGKASSFTLTQRCNESILGRRRRGCRREGGRREGNRAGGGRGLSDDRAHVGRPNTLRPSRAVRPGRMRKCFGAQRGISLPCGHQLRNKRKGRTLGPAKTKILMYVIVITFCTKKIRRCRNRFVGYRKLVPAGRIARQLFCEANLTNDVINNKIMIRRACYPKGITVKTKKNCVRQIVNISYIRHSFTRSS